MSLHLITPPAVEPITLEEAKSHLRVSDDDNNDMLRLYIKAVRQNLDGMDGWLGRALVTQTWELTLDSFPCGEIRIPIPPLQSVTSIKYDDEDGNEQTVDAGDYTVDTLNEPGWVLVNSDESWPTTFNGINAVRVRFVAGYAPTNDSPNDLRANVPAPIKAAMLLMLGTLYENRGEVIVGQTAITMPWASEALLKPYRVFTH